MWVELISVARRDSREGQVRAIAILCDVKSAVLKDQNPFSFGEDLFIQGSTRFGSIFTNRTRICYIPTQFTQIIKSLDITSKWSHGGDESVFVSGLPSPWLQITPLRSPLSSLPPQTMACPCYMVRLSRLKRRETGGP